MREKTVEDALKEITKYYREFRSMAVSAYYGRAVRDLKELIRQREIVASWS